MENEKPVKALTGSNVEEVEFGGNVPELGFSVDEWRKAYFNNEIDPKTNTSYGYRIKPSNDKSKKQRRVS